MAMQLQGFTEHRGLSRKIPKKISHRERQTYFIEGLHNTGPKKAKEIIKEFKTPVYFLTALLKTEILYTKTGNPKGIKGDLQKIKGLGWKFVRDNKKLLLEQESDENSTN
jgi:ERCC4-type nuclease